MSDRTATVVTALVCDAMRNSASVVMRRPDSLSSQPTACWYTTRPSFSTKPTAPPISPESTYCCMNRSMRARRAGAKPDGATARLARFLLGVLPHAREADRVEVVLGDLRE